MLLSVYTQALDVIVGGFLKAALPLLRGFDVRNAGDRKKLEGPLHDLVVSYRGDAVLAANQYMSEAAQELGKQAYIPTSDPYPVEAVGATLREYKSAQGVVDALARHVRAGARRQVQRATPGDPYAPDIPSSVGPLESGSQRNVGSNEPQQGVESAVIYPVSWARVLTGVENCAFCVMLASRGAQYSSKTRAGGAKDDSYRFHDNCDCLVVPVYDFDHWPGKETADYLYEEVWAKSGVKTVEELAAYLKENPVNVPDMRAS